MSHEQHDGFESVENDDLDLTGSKAVDEIMERLEERRLGDACQHSFLNGAPLSAQVILPENGAVFVAQPGHSSMNVEVIGRGAIGMGTRTQHFTYVIDRSGSTGRDCVEDVPDATILDCEKKAIIDFHGTIESFDSTLDYGVVFFGNGGESARFDNDGPGKSLVTTDRGAQENQINTTVNALTEIGSTNFEAALVATVNTVSASSATGNKYVIFLSDGESNQHEVNFPSVFQSSLAALAAANVKIFAFAVGPPDIVNCTKGTAGTLQEMADATGGVCTQVIDPSGIDL